jgi:hypothetical protein
LPGRRFRFGITGEKPCYRQSPQLTIARMQEWSLPYCILAVVLVVAFFSIIRSGLDKRVQMSRTSRAIRVVGGSIWLALALTGIAYRIWESLRELAKNRPITVIQILE